MSLAGRLAIPALCALLAACGSGSTAPSGFGKQPSPPSLGVACAPGPPLACTASFAGDGDVTALASWSAADSFALAMDLPVTPSDAVVFRAPGVPTATRAGNVYLRADYTSPHWAGYHSRNIAPHAYAMTPGGSAEPLAYLSGNVFAATPAPGAPVVGGATVTIVSGEGAGRSTKTLDNGAYWFEFVHLGRPFTIRASKDGYVSDTRDHPGIVDDTLGYPSNSSIALVILPAR